MARFTVTNKAKADLKEIGRFTARRWGKDQRDKYLKMLNEYFEAIASRRAQGMDASKERAGYRKVHVGRHFILPLVVGRRGRNRAHSP
jgi:toxin ParE1/3/4